MVFQMLAGLAEAGGKRMSAGESILGVELLKLLLKPGYLYGIARNGELYCIEAEIPAPGQTVVLPPMHMPET
jgi:hypothetical protein